MTKKEYLKFIEGIYRATRGLIELTPDDKLDFAPREDIRIVSRLLKHLTTCMGESLKMAIDQAWPEMPEGGEMPPEHTMPKSNSAAEALEEIDKDWELLKEQLDRLTDDEFNNTKIKVPWMPFPMTYLEYCMQAYEHLSNHRCQLFIWLKLAGLKLDTHHLYGIAV